MSLIWLRGLLTQRAGRLLAAATGIGIAVALLASLGAFFTASKATMTSRAIASVAVDWQVEVQANTAPSDVLKALNADPGTVAALPVGFAQTTGLKATTAGTTQTTGPGAVLGLPADYRSTFPSALRTLSGSPNGVLLAQQTAANLHVAPGDTIVIGRAGRSPYSATVDGVVEIPPDRLVVPARWGLAAEPADSTARQRRVASREPVPDGVRRAGQQPARPRQDADPRTP